MILSSAGIQDFPLAKMSVNDTKPTTSIDPAQDMHPEKLWSRVMASERSNAPRICFGIKKDGMVWFGFLVQAHASVRI